MSKIGSNENIINQQINIAITTSTFDELEKYRQNGYSVGISGSLLLSIPIIKTDSDEDKLDIINEASIWLTDGSGLLNPISYPISKIKALENDIKKFNDYIININISKIEFIKVTNSNEITDNTNESNNIDYTFTLSSNSNTNIENILVENFKIKITYESGYTLNYPFNLYKVYELRGNNNYVDITSNNNWYKTAGNYKIQGILKSGENSKDTINYIYVNINN